MKRRIFGVLLVGGALAAATLINVPARCANPKRVLVVSQTAGFRHSSVPTAAAFVRWLGTLNHEWDVVGEAKTGEDVAQAITAENLKNVDLVFFGNTTGTLNFSPDGKKAFY